MRICPTCRTAYPARGRATCANDGTRLVDAEEYAASKNDPLLGQLVAGRFHVLERIGTGGMGTVYRAEQSGLDRPVALKVLKRELISDRETVARFHREAKAMSLLMHPNTVRVFDFGEDDDGHLFLAMELLEGELLTAWIEREGTPPIEQAMRTIQEILRSLAEAHSKGIIHRDLKPDNIFLARVEGHSRPVVKVLDFGIAKVFREDRQIDQLETQAGTVFGTPRYMSPEQAQGKTLDHRSDLYTVGTLLYQLLTGSPPFVDDDAVVVMAKHIRETPPSPRVAAPERPIPRTLDKLVMKALGKEPDDRFDNAEAMEARLMACLPDVEREAQGRGGLFAGLPKVPLAIGAALIVLATAFAVTIVISSAPDEVAEARDRLTAPPTTTEVSAPPPEPELPAARSVRLESEPAGARVMQGDVELGTTPLSLDVMDEPLALTVVHDGYEPHDVALTGETPTERVTLTASPAQETAEARPARRGRGRSQEETEPSAQPAETPPTPPASEDPYERFEF
ncbi:MAG: serine/threonine-protein kinase [Myxococcota bacterium]|nr:serine/threonine-protein kinase [Myxococcota bacterium]